MGVYYFVSRRGTGRRAGVVRVLGELGRESTAEGRGKCLEVAKGAAFATFAEGLKTLRKRLGLRGSGKNIICHGRSRPNTL
jgi:hypothetical protein